MKPPKKLIFGTGIFLAGFVFLIIFGNLINPQKTTSSTLLPTKNTSLTLSSSSIETTSSTTPQYESLSLIADEKESVNTSSPITTAEADINKKIAQVLTSLNPDGPTKQGDEKLLKVEDPQVFVDKYLKNELAKITEIIAQESFPTITFPKEQIITAADTSSLTKPLIFLKSALEKYEPKNSDPKEIILAYEALEKDLKNQFLPTLIVPFYERELSLIEQDIKNMKRINTAESKPFEAIIAYKKREEVVIAFESLKSEINTFAKKNQLSFEWL